MNSWVLSIGLTTVILAVLNMILPSGKIGKFITSLFPLIVLLVVIKPIFNIDLNNIDKYFNESEYKVEYQTDYLNSIMSRKKQEIVNNCSNILKLNKIENADIKIEFIDGENSLSIKKVNINLQNAVIKTEDGHIDINRIKLEIAYSLTVDEKAVSIYGK